MEYESKLVEVAPFYDSNSGIKKAEYYKNLIKYLKRIGNDKRFDVIEIKGALPDLNLHQEGEDNMEESSSTSFPGTTRLNLEDQIILLRRASQISQDLKVMKTNSEKSERGYQFS